MSLNAGYGCPICEDLMNKRKETVLQFKASVTVRLRPSVLDPAGEAARSAAHRLGVEGINNLRIGKIIEVEIQAPDEAEARRRMEKLSDRLLANPVIENWSLDLKLVSTTQIA